MNHVTDERAERPLDHMLHDWLDSSIEDLPDGAELPSAIRSDVLSRLPDTPQRRRWWPFRWLPFGSGATRSAEREGPHPEGRSKSMINATAAVAGVAVLALVGSFAYMAAPIAEPDTAPGAEAQAIDPTAFGGFSGTVQCVGGDPGSVTTTDWGSQTKGETYAQCTHHSSDPRISGNGYSVHDSFKYFDGSQVGVLPGGVRTVSSVITNDAGTWVGDQEWGYQNPRGGAMRYVHVYHGTGAYEGLTALMLLTQDRYGPNFDVEGVIIPGDLPTAPEAPIEAALDMWEQLAAD